MTFWLAFGYALAFVYALISFFRAMASDRPGAERALTIVLLIFVLSRVSQ